MEEKTKHPSNQPFFVEIYLSGDGTREEKEVALKKMLRRCHPAVIGKEVLFLEKYEIRDDS